MSVLDALIAQVSPRAAYRRAAWRQGYEEMRDLAARGYGAAARGRLTADWRATHGSADAELVNDLALLRARQRQMERDNPFAAAAKRNLLVGLVGDGIAARAVHPDPAVAELAQTIFDDWAAGPVDGRDDFYGSQKLSVSAMISAGDSLTVWRPKNGKPDGYCTVYEGDWLDHNLNRLVDGGGRIVGGVEYDRDGIRVAYWLHKDHPGDLLARTGRGHNRIAAADVDHLFEATRPGQSRGAPWFHAGIRLLRDVDDVHAAFRIKKRIEACLTVFRRPSSEAQLDPLGKVTPQASGPDWEKLAPGMVVNGQPGEEAPTVINPSSTGDGDGFLRSQVMAACAALGVPYHLASGDVSQANYSSIRTDTVGYHGRLDDWTFNTIVPHKLAPAFARVMRRAALETGERRLLEVKSEWTPPPRPWVDPLKDITAQILEARAIPGALAGLLTARGFAPAKAMKLQAELNALIDKHGLALDTDPRRLNGSGALQPAAGYLAPRDGDREIVGQIAALLIGGDSRS